MAYTPLDDGHLTKKERYFKTDKMNVLSSVSEECSKTLGQVALNWCTSNQNVIAIPKSNSLERTIENCGASDWRLSDEQIKRLNDAFS